MCDGGVYGAMRVTVMCDGDVCDSDVCDGDACVMVVCVMVL